MILTGLFSFRLCTEYHQHCISERGVLCRSVGTILTGLFSFMLSDDITTGSMKASRAERRRLAEQSLETNLRDPTFRKLFPEYVQQLEERREAQVPLPSHI